jgi:hypothetical protein
VVNGAVTVTDGEDDDERERESAVSYRSWKMWSAEEEEEEKALLKCFFFN